jgi:hypothetical protein
LDWLVADVAVAMTAISDGVGDSVAEGLKGLILATDFTDKP